MLKKAVYLISFTTFVFMTYKSSSMERHTIELTNHTSNNDDFVVVDKFVKKRMQKNNNQSKPQHIENQVASMSEGDLIRSDNHPSIDALNELVEQSAVAQDRINRVFGFVCNQELQNYNQKLSPVCVTDLSGQLQQTLSHIRNHEYFLINTGNCFISHKENCVVGIKGHICQYFPLTNEGYAEALRYIKNC